MSVSPSEIVVRLPNAVTSIEASVEVVRGSRTKMGTALISMLNPEIHSVNDTSFTVGDVITIQGSSFHPIPSKNEVKVGGQILDVESSTGSTLIVRVPNSIIINPLFSQVTQGPLILSTEIGSNQGPRVELSYIGPWKKLSSPNLLAPNHYGMVTAKSNNEMFMFGGHKFESGIGFTYSNSIQAYNLESDTWREIDVLPAEGRDYSQFILDQNYLYLGSGQTTEYLPDFWKYDFGTSSWQPLNDVPYYTANRIPKSVVLGDRFFTYTDNRKLFEYSKVNDTWNEVPLNLESSFFVVDLSKENSRLRITAIEINNQATQNSTLHVIDYDPVNYTYEIVDSYSPFPYSNSYIKSSLNKNFLVQGRGLFLLDGGNTSEVLLPYQNQSIHYSESLGGKIYIGFNNGEFWMFDPSLL